MKRKASYGKGGGNMVTRRIRRKNYKEGLTESCVSSCQCVGGIWCAMAVSNQYKTYTQETGAL